MANIIKPKRSESTGQTPTLSPGELAVNITDKKVWVADSSGTPVLIVDGNASSGVAAINDLTDVTITTAANGNFLRYNSTSSQWENVVINTDSISEGTTNLFFTDSRARSSISAGTGISFNSSTGVISATGGTGTVTEVTGGSFILIDGIANSAINTKGTISVNATSGNTASSIVARDSTGAFSAGNITATLIGNATNAANVLLGSGGQIVCQSSASTTSFITNGTSGQILKANGGTSLPTWVNQNTLTVGNLTGGNNTTLLGSIPYQSNTDTTSLLSPNTTTTKKFLRQTGTGTNGAAPAWDTVTASDVGLGNVSNTAQVTSVTGTSPVASTGGTTPAISLASGYGDTQNPYASKTANYVLAAPNGLAGVPTFRALVAADIPTLNQNTTGSSGSCTGNSATATKSTNLIGGNSTTLLGSIPYQSNTDTTTLLGPNTTTTKKFLRQTGTGTNGAAPAWDTVVKSDIGLGNVENTALSTWAGSSSITTVGTLTALKVGTLTYPSTDGTSGQVLSTNGAGAISWSTVGGTSAAGSTGDIQYNDGTGGFTATSNFSYGSSAYDKLAIYSTTATDNVVGIFAASLQSGNLLEFRNYIGTTVFSYFDATGNLYLNAQGNIRFADADNSNYVAIQSPATIATNYTLTLPTTAGTNNYVLKTDGSGNLSWTNAVTNLLGGNSTTLLGSIGYQSNTNTTTLLSPNTTTTKKYLAQTGTGTNGAAPTWSQPAVTEISASTAGGAVYSTASALAVTAAGTSGQVLRSNGSSAPTWEAQGFFSGGRLTLTSATPITTTDVTAATTLYFTPYGLNGDKISLYDGTNWATYTFSQLSLALGTLSSGFNYDVFVYNNAGTLTLETAVWTNDTTRATSLTLTNGIYLKTGALTRRFLGTFRTTSTTTTEDSIAKRFVWNFNNRVEKALYKNGTTSHTYTTASWRNWNNDATLRIEFILGIDAAQVIHFGGAATGTGIDIGAGFDGGTPGYDSVNSTGTGVSQIRGGRAYSSRGTFLGYHYCQMQEYGASGTTFLDARLEGTIWC